jgi:hypothetical protein
LKSYIIKSLSSDISSDNYSFLLEFNIIYSEVYQMPTAYFSIINLEKNNPVNFDDFIKLSNKDIYSNNDFISKGYEVSRVVSLFH